METKNIRTRWAAVGAAVAITLGAGGIGLVSATSPAGATAFIPITPCRLADTRPAPDNVGPRNTPVGAAETLVIMAEGNQGNCVGIPTSATGLELNVTALGATERSYLTIWGEGARPTASHLNPIPGAPPVPNSVTTGLTAAGAINMYNNIGTVNVIVDIVGYYADHSHSSTDITNESGISYNQSNAPTSLTGTPAAVISTIMRVPSDGYVSIEVTGNWLNNDAAIPDLAFCQLQKGAAGAVDIDLPFIQLADRNTGIQGYSAFSAHRVMPIAVADNPFLFTSGQTLSLVCDEILGDVRIDDVQISATFHPTSYAPFIIILPFP